MHNINEPTQRQLRVAEQVRKIIGEFFLKNISSDPILIDASITVSMVTMSKDLKIAYIYVMPLGGTNAPEIKNALDGNKFFYQKELGKKIKTKFTPKIIFYIDDTFVEAEKINKLLLTKKIKKDLI